MFSWLTSIDISKPEVAAVLLTFAVLGCVDLAGRFRHHPHHWVFGCLLGTILAAGSIRATQVLLQPDIAGNAYVVAVGVVLLAVCWRLLFGPWHTKVKATVLGTFLFWLSLNIFLQETSSQRMIHGIAILVALIPAVLWCMLFLPYHREQLSRVFLMFFAGMMSTAPILFYDTLVRHGVELQFFYFRIVPESFNVTSQSLVMGQLSGGSTVRTTVLSLLLTFLCVGFIEEFSKYWVLRKSGQSVFSSIDDVIQLSIIVAIGFAFAENIISTGYFVSFVKQFVMVPSPNWSAFFSNVAGRAVLTSMVHIISTGLMGYFLGRALFAESLLAEHPKRVYLVTDLLHGILGLPKKRVFQMVSFLTGITLAASIHAFANFIVSLPNVLPGNPQTIGQVFQLPAASPLNLVSLMLLPSLLYVVGGFWLLTWLFERKDNEEERGHVIVRDLFVTEKEAL